MIVVSQICRGSCGNFIQGLRKICARLTEIFLKAYGEKLGGLRKKVSLSREILLEQHTGLTMFRESGFGNKIDHFYFKIRRTMNI